MFTLKNGMYIIGTLNEGNMFLDEWFWRAKITKRKFAKDIGIHPQTVFTIIERIHTPSLFTALAIEKYTNGEVTLFELLSEKDYNKFLHITLREDCSENCQD